MTKLKVQVLCFLCYTNKFTDNYDFLFLKKIIQYFFCNFGYYYFIWEKKSWLVRIVK